jgi:pyruvate-ferredoxin/flavodoxin oxidoreductase
LPDEGFANPYPGTAFVEAVAKPVNANRGYTLPVSAFVGYEDGTMEHGSTEYEKRGISTSVPIWHEKDCTQCNQCVFVCPHAVIRPFLLTDDELAQAPEGVRAQTLPTKGKALGGLTYRLQVSPLDCTGCELCVAACPVPDTLEMAPLQDVLDKGEQECADYLFGKVTYKDNLLKKSTQKGSSFAQPLFEFHAACPGCGETPYITLLTRLYGESMMVANSTGCSSIYGAAMPSTPYRKNAEGRGPAWANSLFEDNAEFGFGMHLASQTIRHRIENIIRDALPTLPEDLATLCAAWLEAKEDRVKSLEIRNALVPVLEAHPEIPAAQALLGLKQYLAKRSQWIIGGDGWAYDIGYGGLDHVLASGENVKMLVLDTEVYSNTGGQSSKASRTGSVAQFSASGKPVQKKELGYLAMTYGNIYVAQINSGANAVQTLRCIEEAEAYDGPALIVAYSPCIAHGIQGGLSKSLSQAELASKSGYWPLYSYDPRLVKEGKNPIKITGGEPDWSLYETFLLNEVRYGSLKKINPEHAAALFDHNKKDAQRRFRQLARMSKADYSDEIAPSMPEVVD